MDGWIRWMVWCGGTFWVNAHISSRSGEYIVNALLLLVFLSASLSLFFYCPDLSHHEMNGRGCFCLRRRRVVVLTRYSILRSMFTTVQRIGQVVLYPPLRHTCMQSVSDIPRHISIRVPFLPRGSVIRKKEKESCHDVACQYNTKCACISLLCCTVVSLTSIIITISDALYRQAWETVQYLWFPVPVPFRSVYVCVWMYMYNRWLAMPCHAMPCHT
mmetsp:Transcript_3939/g.4074  ORF Transcript_3939/g.4074 Transcript_3939/m.4074 type:complete len:216 (-) Transcript_3939:1250-1897(-)